MQKIWTVSDRIQLIMAERTNRLSLLADPDQDLLLSWFDDAHVIILQGTAKSHTYNLKDYITYTYSDTQERRKRILEKSMSFLEKKGWVTKNDILKSVDSITKKYGKPTVSLVELIYRTLFELKNKASKFENIVLDWEEWEFFINNEFKVNETHTELYGIIAALKIFNTPITTSLFCKYFGFQERKLKYRLNERLMSKHIEPVIFHEGSNTLRPKHDVIAELFFLFNNVSINNLMIDLLKCMDENEIETLLSNMIIKKEIESRKKYHVGQIHYNDYMNTIYERIVTHTCNLSETGAAHLCLGYLWARFENNTPKYNTHLNNILDEIAPQIDDSLIMAKLYTEWGIWAKDMGNIKLAEEKYRAVINNYPKNVPARTELGRLLSKQKGRLNEAEEVLRQVIKIDSRNLHARKVLARLYEDCDRPEDAILLYKEICKYDPDNPYGKSGLARLQEYDNDC